MDRDEGLEGQGEAVAASPAPVAQARMGRCRLCLMTFSVVPREGRGRPAPDDFCSMSHRQVWWRLYHPRIFNQAAGNAAVEIWREERAQRMREGVTVRTKRLQDAHNRQERARLRRRRLGLKPFEGTRFEGLSQRPATRLKRRDFIVRVDDPSPLNMDCALCRIGGVPCRLHL